MLGNFVWLSVYDCRSGGVSCFKLVICIKTTEKFQAVRDLNLHVPKGDLFGFVGPNGAGKTTTIRMVCGLMPPTEGTITIHGVDALLHPKEIKKQIGYVPDFFGVYDNLKVSEYMDFYGSMYRMTSREITAVSNDLLELVNLSDKKRGLCGYAFPRNEAAAVCGTGTHPQSFPSGAG